MEEVWKEIPGYDGYMASTFGRIKSVDRIVNYNNRFCKRKGKILKPHKSKIGYLTVAPKQKTTYVHYLVTLTFFGKRNKNTVVDHINGEYTDNRIENLRYVTQLENVQNALRLNKILTGEKCSWSKLKVEDVIKIRNDNRSSKLISLDYNVSRSTIDEIKKFLIWKNI